MTSRPGVTWPDRPDCTPPSGKACSPAGLTALSLLACILVGCGFDAEPIEVKMQARQAQGSVELQVERKDFPINGREDVTWELALQPVGARLREPQQDRVLLEFEPVVGTYVVDRWSRLGANDSWTHRFIVDVYPPAPTVSIIGPESGRPGELLVYQARVVGLDRNIAPAYEWSLPIIFPGDTVGLSSRDSQFTSLYAAQAGDQYLALRVFDGLEWTPEVAVTIRIGNP